MTFVDIYPDVTIMKTISESDNEEPVLNTTNKILPYSNCNYNSALKNKLYYTTLLKRIQEISLREYPSIDTLLKDHISVEKKVNISVKTLKKRTQGQLIDSKEIRDRRNQYWWQLITSPFYYNNLNKAKKIIEDLPYKISPATTQIEKQIRDISSNDITIKDFFNEDIKHYVYPSDAFDGWNYMENINQPLPKIPMRWRGQLGVNFFEPLVFRYKINSNNKRCNKQGLCPYCPLTTEDVKTKYNFKFYKMKNNSYKDHLLAYHGIQCDGSELPPPVVCVDEFDRQALVCTECQHVITYKNNNGNKNKRKSKNWIHLMNKHFVKSHILEVAATKIVTFENKGKERIVYMKYEEEGTAK